MIPPKPSENITDFIDYCHALSRKFGVAAPLPPVHRGAAGRRRRNREALHASAQHASALPWKPVGASEEAVLKFMEICGHDLPTMYVDFLLHFGEGDGGLETFDAADGSVSGLSEYYGRCRAGVERTLPENTVLIAACIFYMDYSLVYSPAEPSRPPMVAESGDFGKILRPRAASFRNFLYSQAFGRFAFPWGPRHAFLHSNDRAAMLGAVDIAVRSGFEPSWFSDEYQSCLMRDEDLLNIRQKYGKLYFSIHGRDAGTADELRRRFLDGVAGLRGCGS